MIPNLKEKTILVVDDDPASLFLFTEILQPTGAAILTADRGSQALALLKEQFADLVLLDIKLCDTSGFTVYKEIRKIDASIRVVAQTAYALEVVNECIEAGFDDYLFKPINAAELFEKIERLLLTS